MKRNKLYIITIVFFLLATLNSIGQEKHISVKAKNESLNATLEDISSRYQIPFAFDADYFSQLEANFQFDDITLTDFLTEICQQFHLIYEKIDNTWVLYKNPAPIPPKVVETIKIEGLVADRNSGEPLLFCNIGIGENRGTITNELGIFSDKIEKTSQVTISISHLGYQRLDTTLTIVPNGFYKITLIPFSFHLETINVYQQEKNVIEMSNQSDRIAFNPKQSANLPRIDDSDLITALSLIPGVNFLGGQTSGISIRGGSPSENLVLLDGMPVLETGHLFRNMSVLNAKFISQAFVSRGAFDATYGERISGIIELTGQNNYHKPSLDLSANLLNVNASAEVPIGNRVSVSGAYRKSYIDKWENYLYEQILAQGNTSNDDGASVFPTVLFDDLNLKLSVKPTDKQEISVNSFESNDLQKRDFVFKEGSRFFREEQADSKNRGISGNWRYQSGTNWQHHFNIGYNDLGRTSWSHSGMGPNSQGKGGKDDLNMDDNYLEEIIASWSSEFKTGKFTHQFGFGGDFDYVTYDYREEQSVGNVKIDSINYDSEVTILHAYMQEKIQLLDNLHVRLGVRVNQQNATNDFYIQPRFGVNLNLSESLNLFYSGGLYNQFLSRIRKIDSNGNSDLVWYLPDSTGVGILKAHQHTIGLRFEKNGFAIDLESYYKKTTGKVNLYGEVIGNKEKSIEYIQREGESGNYGLDALIHYKQGIFTHMLAWSVSKSTERFDNFNAGLKYPSFDDQRHRIRWTEMARYKGWIVSTNLTYHTGSPYLLTQNEGSTLEFGQLPYFAQADFSIIKRINYKFFNLSTGISLLNVFNRQNVLEVDYFSVSDGTGSYSIRTDITAMKFTPVFFINIKLQ